jgi:drug/metabolite transporter (DMT)-like permease
MGALVWGLVWYPFRALNNLGIDGVAASAATYSIALLLSIVGYRRKLADLRLTRLLVLIAIATGLCNVGFVLATIHGHVVRVVLLFYLAPVWTVIFAYFLLGERLSAQGVWLMLLALGGAFVMLWNPMLGMPLPNDSWEWVALAAGVLFAFANVLLRKAQAYPIEHKSLCVFAGCVLVSLLAFALLPVVLPTAGSWSATAITLLVLIGIIMWAVNYGVQYGLGRVPANQAIVIYLSELVFAAAASWLLAGEALTAKEWVGGAMIVGASLLSGRLRPPPAPNVGPAAVQPS